MRATLQSYSTPLFTVFDLYSNIGAGYILGPRDSRLRLYAGVGRNTDLIVAYGTRKIVIGDDYESIP